MTSSRDGYCPHVQMVTFLFLREMHQNRHLSSIRHVLH